MSATDHTPPVVYAPPVDPGDAGGVRNDPARRIARDTLHEAVEDVAAREDHARLAGRPGGIQATKP